MITFIEKEPFNSSVIPGKVHQLAPIFMVKDGKEYFMVNRGIVCDNKNDSEIEAYKAMLLSNNGIYFKFYGYQENPLDLIADMKKHRHHFVYSKKIFERLDSVWYGEGFTDFSGNLKEVSAAFHYRIFYEDFVKEIKARVETITEYERRK